MEIIFFVLVALLILSFLVVIHELGHFWAAKIVGVWPEEFGIGLPPRVWGKKFGETLWSLNALPLGGFVRLHGETSEAGLSKPERSFIHKSKLARAFVALAGISINVLYAVFVFSLIFFLVGVPRGIKVDKSVSPKSPAAAAGLREKDVILAIDGKSLYEPNFFGSIVSAHAGKKISMKYESEDKKLNEVSFVLRAQAPEGQGLLGVKYNAIPAGYEEAQGINRFFVSVKYGAIQTWDFTVLIFGEFKKMFTQIFTGKVPQGLTGPVGVVGVTASAVQQGFYPVIFLSALISLNLAIINLVPFPPLDGSRVLFLIIEKIVGKRRLPKYEEKVHAVGMYILLILVAFLTLREIPKVFTAGSLDNFVQSLTK